MPKKILKSFVRQSLLKSLVIKKSSAEEADVSEE